MCDFKFIKVAAKKNQFEFNCIGVETLKLSRLFHPESPKKTLEAMCEQYEIKREHCHRAYDDAYATALIYEKMYLENFEKKSELFQFQTFFYEPKKQEPMTKRQRLYITDLCNAYSLQIPNDIESYTKSKASRFIDQTIFRFGKLRL